MDQAGIVTMIDEALERFAAAISSRSSEVVDFLLDLRSAVVSDAALAALIESETATRALTSSLRASRPRSRASRHEFARIVQ